jgi:ABC-type molybdate transport system ATPase subunit
VSTSLPTADAGIAEGCGDVAGEEPGLFGMEVIPVIAIINIIAGSHRFQKNEVSIENDKLASLNEPLTVEILSRRGYIMTISVVLQVHYCASKEVERKGMKTRKGRIQMG